jgi:hypothetical protein
VKDFTLRAIANEGDLAGHMQPASPPQPTPRVLVLLFLAAILTLAAWHLRADRQREQQDTRERHIDSLTAFAAHAKARLVIKRRENDQETRVALKTTGAYHAERKAVTLDLGPSTISAVGLTPQAVPPIALSLIVHCDSAIAQLERSLVGARAIAALERSRGDSLERASTLKDDRPGPDRCGMKCGAVLVLAAEHFAPRLGRFLWNSVVTRQVAMSASPNPMSP